MHTTHCWSRIEHGDGLCECGAAPKAEPLDHAAEVAIDAALYWYRAEQGEVVRAARLRDGRGPGRPGQARLVAQLLDLVGRQRRPLWALMRTLEEARDRLGGARQERQG